MTIKTNHKVDQDGNPAGGLTVGTGFGIEWQDGPLAVDGVRKEPNGAFVEDIIEAAINRLEFYQTSKFACLENQAAIDHLRVALDALKQRTKRRTQEGKEGTHLV